MNKLKYRQKEFKGLMVKIATEDLPPEYSPDCENVVVSVGGEVTNISGMEKQATSGYTNDVVAIRQLDSDDATLAEVTA